jgi:CcmD family protein
MKALRVMALSFALFAPAIALAQEDDAAESRATAFEAAEGAQIEQVPGGTLLITAYGAAFVFVLAYVLSLGIRQSSTQRDLERLRKDLAAAEKSKEP